MLLEKHKDGYIKMAKKLDELDTEELLEKVSGEDLPVPDVDDNPIEEVPTQDILVDVLMRDKDNWRFMAFGLIFCVIALGYFLYDLSDQRTKDTVVVYNQATGETALASQGNYTAEGFLLTVSRGVMLFNSWDYDIFDNTMALVSDIVSEDLIKMARVNYNKKKAVWNIDHYSQKLKVMSAQWPTDKNGQLLKWVRGLKSFHVIVDGEFTVSRKSKSKTFPLKLDIYCEIITPNLKHPHGFLIKQIGRVQG